MTPAINKDMRETDLLIIGAGPYGLAVGSYARRLGLECRVVGEPMGFWKNHMPDGMLLRSPTSWHLDAVGEMTFEGFLEFRGLAPAQVSPISLGLYLDYCQWFQAESDLEVERRFVNNLEWSGKGDSSFRAVMDDGSVIEANRVLAATGLTQYQNIPKEVAELLPLDCYVHTCDCVDFSSLKGKRCLIVGGRQSAFEWAALIAEEAGAEIHLVYRHDTPAFTESDWDWIDELMEWTRSSPGWYGRLSAAEKDGIFKRLWGEGRLKLEPWLYPRIQDADVHMWPNTRITGGQRSQGAVAVTLDNGKTLEVDQVIFATGYRVDLSLEPYLRDPSIVGHLKLEEGFPVLDESFQSSIPGLYFTGQTATRDFGPFFGFGIGCPAAAWVIGNALEGQGQ